ncbi:hypothetical protein GUI12_04435 [Anaplasmataceae bacterium AB001_6]|nr:hypothetical protein GUI12_04435 [Anaplasmataceae bacterium AB001_6]
MKININNLNGTNNIKPIQKIKFINHDLITNNKSNVGAISNVTGAFKNVLKTSETKTKEAITDKAALYDVVTTISKAEAELKLLLTLRDVTVNAWNELIKMNI